MTPCAEVAAAAVQGLCWYLLRQRDVGGPWQQRAGQRCGAEWVVRHERVHYRVEREHTGGGRWGRRGGRLSGLPDVVTSCVSNCATEECTLICDS